jgi:sphingomyelin phosphodiesterase 2
LQTKNCTYWRQAGDFNSAPHTLPMTIVGQHAGLCDIWDAVHPSHAHADPIEPLSALAQYGFTYDSPLNSYSTGESWKETSGFPQGKRLDYILFRNPVSSSSTLSRGLQLTPVSSNVVLTGAIPGYTCSYSDHFAVDATLKVERAEGSASVSDKQPSALAPAFARGSYLSHEHTMAVVRALQAAREHSLTRTRGQMRIFYTGTGFLICLFIGTGWSPKGYLTPAFLLLGVIATWLTTTMFYVGLFYGKWEAKALRNAIEELELYARHIN